jgi:hypothetical protein
VRKDIPVADQIVQVGHATLEAGRAFKWNDGTHMIVLEAESEKELLSFKCRAEYYDVKCQAFYEPDDAMGWTAFCTEPISGKTRKLFFKYPLWTA